MKTCKLLFVLFIVGACALGAHAQKQFKYMPQAIKGVKKVPYVLNPQLPLSVQAQFAILMERPKVAVGAPVERAVIVSLQEFMRGAGLSGPALGRTPEEVLTQTEQFVEKNGYFPSRKSNHKTERALRAAFDQACKNAETLKDSTGLKLLFLREVYVRAKLEQEKQQRAWENLELQAKTLTEAAEEETVLAPAETAAKAATLAEEQWVFPIAAPTDKYIDYLLRFYNKLDPMETGTIQ